MSTASSNGTASSGPTAAQWYRSYLHALCRYQQACSTVRGPQFTTEAACDAQVDLGDEIRMLQGMPTTDAFIDATYAITDPVAAQACLDGIARLAPTAGSSSGGTAASGSSGGVNGCLVPVPRVAACDNVATTRTPRALATECNDTDKLCTNNTAVCAPLPTTSAASGTAGNNTCRTCQALIALGRACSANDDCASRYCSPSSRLCENAPVSLFTAGTSCSTDSECLGALSCVGTAGARHCTARGGQGATCAGPLGTPRLHPPCQEDLDCVSTDNGATGQCQARIPDGQTCYRDTFFILLPNPLPPAGSTSPIVVQARPACRNFCTFAQADSATGTCGTRTSAPTDGQPCTSLSRFAPLACGTYPDANAQVGLTNSQVTVGTSNYYKASFTSCSCSTKSATSPCLDNGSCKNARCDRTGMTFPPAGAVTPGTCSTLFALTHACEADSDCASGRCVGSACADKAGFGVACAQDSNCASTFCDPATHRCGDLATCPN